MDGQIQTRSTSTNFRLLYIRSSVYFGCGFSTQNTKSYKQVIFFYFFVRILVNATTWYISEIQKFPVKRLYSENVLVNLINKYFIHKITYLFLVQGVRGQSVFFNWALRERNIQVRLYLKVVLKFWDVEILIIRTNFQKSSIGWPQQPPAEKVP